MKSQIKFNILTTIVFAALAFAAVPSARADGKLLSHLSFNDKANPLKVEGGADAVVRRNRNEKVSDMGEVKWEANGGDGAVAIPIGWHIAVPIPEELTKEPGHPFSVEMKVRFSKFQANTYPSLLNMPADNASPGMLYLVTDSQYVDPVICVKQWDKSWGAGEKGKSGFTAEKWETVLAVFDREKTEVFLNGDKIISCKGKLAGSYADCSKAGGYILLSADPSPSGGTIHWADLKIYAGTEGTGGGTTTQGGGGTSSSGGGTTSQGGSATPTSKVNGGVGCFYPASAHGGMLRQEPVKMPDAKRAPDYLNPDGTPVGSEQKPSAEVQQTLTMFSEDDGLSAAEKIPALKAYIETHLNEPGIAKLIDLLEKLAKEANDEETLKWVEEIRKKLADASEAKDGKGNKDATDVAAPEISDELDEPDEPIEIMSDPAREAKLRERRKDPARAAAAAKFLLDL